jgi:hypothetical protein
MIRKATVSCFVVLTMAALSGCSSKPADSQKAAVTLHKIQGKAQVLIESGGAADAALNAGGASSIYIWEGARRYRLFLGAPVVVEHGQEYIVDGVYAQKVIDEIGDPDQGKTGYPLQSSCERVVKMAWSNLAFDAVDAKASALRAKVQRYPARPVFLVAKIQPAPPKEEAAKKASATKVPEIEVAAEKQSALLLAGSPVQPAPLWEPAGGTVKCEVVIDAEGKIEELATGKQLCETMNWSEFRYKPMMQGGRAVKVLTEVELKFEPRK